MYVCNFSNGARWLPGKISAVLGSRHFEVKLSDGRIVKKHLDHVRMRTSDVAEKLPEYLPIDPQPRVNEDHVPADLVDNPSEPQLCCSTRNR